MQQFHRLAVALVVAIAAPSALASTAYGDLNNFDAVNDTGVDCHGFEIEVEGVRSTDISYTYDWNHYGPPKIREDVSDPLHPRVFVRYESGKNADGSWAAYTAVPPVPLTPTDGHSCTNPTINNGCEHFGVGFLAPLTAVRYNWLVENPSSPGTLMLGPAVAVATPTWVYSPPVLIDPGLPPDPGNIAQPANVVAAIPAPELPVPAGKAFGPAVWMKVIKTTAHNANPVELAELVSDLDANGDALWQNGEPDQVETEWKLMQNRADGLDGLDGMADDMGDGDEVVTRRYEFFDYVAGDGSIDGETGEAMCDKVAADGLHGDGIVGVTDANGGSHDFDCGAVIVVGDYIGAQMAGFDAEAPLGLIDNLPDGDYQQAYTARRVVIGGNTPYAITASGLPAGMSLGDYTDPDSGETHPGVLFGTPDAGGDFTVNVSVTDASSGNTVKAYLLHVAGGPPPSYTVSVSKTGAGSGSVSGNGIACGATCSVTLDAGTNVSLAATADAGSVFTGWGGDCSGTGACNVNNLSADAAVTASFVPATQKFALTVSKSGSGSVGSSPKGISCGKQCAASFTVGTTVTLAAKPAKRKSFLGWSGACSGTALTCTVSILGATSVGAAFSP